MYLKEGCSPIFFRKTLQPSPDVLISALKSYSNLYIKIHKMKFLTLKIIAKHKENIRIKREIFKRFCEKIVFWEK